MPPVPPSPSTPPEQRARHKTIRVKSSVGASPLPLSTAGRTFIQRITSPPAQKAANPLRSIAALQNVADFARRFPNLAPASWSVVVGASPLPLSYAGRAFIPLTTSSVD
jgi:hypothetical protein